MKALFDLESAAMRQGAFSRSLNITDPDDLRVYIMQSAVYAISRYVTTGRAWRGWEAAFSRADPEKLLAHIVKGGTGTDDEYVKRATAYLRRFCKLSAA